MKKQETATHENSTTVPFAPARLPEVASWERLAPCGHVYAVNFVDCSWGLLYVSHDGRQTDLELVVHPADDARRDSVDRYVGHEVVLPSELRAEILQTRLGDELWPLHEQLVQSADDPQAIAMDLCLSIAGQYRRSAMECLIDLVAEDIDEGHLGGDKASFVGRLRSLQRDCQAMWGESRDVGRP